MQALNLPAEQVLTVCLGKTVTVNDIADGPYVLAAQANQQANLPNAVALAIASIRNNIVTFIALIHPFAADNTNQIFEVEDQVIHREPYNWFGPQALVIEKKLQDYLASYDGPRDEYNGVPRQYIPDKIAQPVIMSDLYWQTYANFVNDPDGTFANQIKPIFTD